MQRNCLFFLINIYRGKILNTYGLSFWPYETFCHVFYTVHCAMIDFPCVPIKKMSRNGRHYDMRLALSVAHV